MQVDHFYYNGQWEPLPNDVVETVDRKVYENLYEPVKLPFEIPKDPHKFYVSFGFLPHPRKRDPNGFPLPVKRLAEFQYDFWKEDRAVMLKANKIGMTTSESLADFQTRLLPETAGFDCLLIGQNQFIADQHLLDLKRMVLRSETYRRFMITRPDLEIMREEKTKARQMYVKNPYDSTRPSRIIALGFSESLAYSWKNINRIHISDPGMIARTEQLSFFSGLYSRLSNTEGQIKIEGVANYRRGYFYELCKKLFNIEDRYEDEQNYQDPLRPLEQQLEDPNKITESFKPFKVTIEDAIAAGIITREWANYMKSILPISEYDRLYLCEFAQPEGASFGEFSSGEHQSLGLRP